MEDRQSTIINLKNLIREKDTSIEELKNAKGNRESELIQNEMNTRILEKDEKIKSLSTSSEKLIILLEEKDNMIRKLESTRHNDEILIEALKQKNNNLVEENDHLITEVQKLFSELEKWKEKYLDLSNRMNDQEKLIKRCKILEETILKQNDEIERLIDAVTKFKSDREKLDRKVYYYFN